MPNWIFLSKAAAYVKDRVGAKEVTIENFVTTDNLEPNKKGLRQADGLPPSNEAMPAYKPDDILIANIRPYLKKIWFSDRTGGCSSDVLIVRAKKGYNPKFIYYNLFKDDFFAHVMNGKKGTKMPRGDKDQIMEFILPDYGWLEQQRISDVLSALDAKIELNNRINVELEDMVKLLFDYWFVQFDFPNEDNKPYKSGGGKMVYDEELKREIPKGWEVAELRKWVTSNRGISYNGTELIGHGIPMINLNSFNINSTYKPEGIKTYSGEDQGSKFLKPFDLVMCNTQQTALDPHKDVIGKSFLVPDVFDTKVVSSHHVTTIGVSKEILKYYLNSLFASEYFHRYISGYCTGTNILGLDFEGVLSFKIALPKDKLLLNFKSIVINAEKQRSLALRENQELLSLRDWLLPLLMNGQVKVANYDTEQKLPQAAEPKAEYGKVIRMQPKAVINEPEEQAFLKRKMLATYIINQSLEDPQFGDTKFEKLLHLTDYHVIKRNLNQQYLKKAAGPYDNKFTFPFFQQVIKDKWFWKEKLGNFNRIRPGSKHASSLKVYDYFSEEEMKAINALIRLFKDFTYEQPEIVSTLYAVWNNRLLLGQPINDELLKQDFLAWDKQKIKYKDRLDNGLAWMCKHNIVPDGWGKVIEPPRK